MRANLKGKIDNNSEPDAEIQKREKPAVSLGKRGFSGVSGEWRRAGSNRQPPACKAGALPIELRPRNTVFSNSFPCLAAAFRRRSYNQQEKTLSPTAMIYAIAIDLTRCPAKKRPILPQLEAINTVRSCPRWMVIRAVAATTSGPNVRAGYVGALPNTTKATRRK